MPLLAKLVVGGIDRRAEMLASERKLGNVVDKAQKIACRVALSLEPLAKKPGSPAVQTAFQIGSVGFFDT